MLQNETVRISYAGNNSTSTAYVVPFKFFAATDLVVITQTSGGVETTLTNGSQYTVSGAVNEAGGSLTTASAVPVSSTVIIYRRTAATQLTDYVEGDAFPAASHEDALDRTIMLDQEQRDELGHTIRIPLSANPAAPLTTYRDAVFGFDSAGAPNAKTSSELLAWLGGSIPVGNFPVATVANTAGRTAATPAYIGQVLSQRDTRKVYFGTALTAGSWQEIDYATGLSLITGVENDFFQWKSGAWTNRTPAQAKVDLGWNAALYPAFITLTDAATITWTMVAGQVTQNARVTLGGNRTLAFSGIANGMNGTLLVIQDGTGSRTLAMPGNAEVIGGGSGGITLSTAASSVDILTWKDESNIL